MLNGISFPWFPRFSSVYKKDANVVCGFEISLPDRVSVGSKDLNYKTLSPTSNTEIHENYDSVPKFSPSA